MRDTWSNHRCNQIQSARTRPSSHTPPDPPTQASCLVYHAYQPVHSIHTAMQMDSCVYGCAQWRRFKVLAASTKSRVQAGTPVSQIARQIASHQANVSNQLMQVQPNDVLVLALIAASKRDLLCLLRVSLAHLPTCTCGK